LISRAWYTHLALAARGVGPVLLLHALRLAHEVQLDDLVVDGVQALLGDVDFLAAGNHDGAQVLAGAAEEKGRVT